MISGEDVCCSVMFGTLFCEMGRLERERELTLFT